MGNLSEHFSRYEFACKCGCGWDVVDYELLSLLQVLRDTYKAPITITSGCRCRAYNAVVGGAKDSQHCYGKAVDFVVTGVEPNKVYEYLNTLFPLSYGLGDYNDWTHFDVRSNKARW